MLMKCFVDVVMLVEHVEQRAGNDAGNESIQFELL